MKSRPTVIEEFNKIVNMTASELETWLKSNDSKSAGWPKENAGGDSETIGHSSGVKIVEILQANSEKQPQKYTDEQVEHMRKVVGYCKRHLAQETSGNQHKSPEEIKNTKSYASLRNWGHDILRAQRQDHSGAEKTRSSTSNGRSTRNKTRIEGSSRAKPDKTEDGKDGEEEGKKGQGEEEEEEEEEEEDEEGENVDGENEEEEEREVEEQVGDKRKKTRQQTGANKKRETEEGAAAQMSKQEGNEEVEENEDKEDEIEKDEDIKTDGDTKKCSEEEEADEKHNRKRGVFQDKHGKESTSIPSKGDTVSWNWGSGHPQGKVLEVNEVKTTITTKQGNKVSRMGNPKDPAVVLDAGKSEAIKLAHELN